MLSCYDHVIRMDEVKSVWQSELPNNRLRERPIVNELIVRKIAVRLAWLRLIDRCIIGQH